jgi:hypothetical protein
MEAGLYSVNFYETIRRHIQYDGSTLDKQGVVEREVSLTCPVVRVVSGVAMCCTNTVGSTTEELNVPVLAGNTEVDHLLVR